MGIELLGKEVYIKEKAYLVTAYYFSLPEETVMVKLFSPSGFKHMHLDDFIASVQEFIPKGVKVEFTHEGSVQLGYSMGNGDVSRYLDGKEIIKENSVKNVRAI